MDIIRTPKISNIKMLDKCQSLIHQSTDSTKTHNTILGTLYLTATHLIFREKEVRQEIWILNSHLSSITKHPVVSDGTPIQIKCKNFCTNTFIIPKEKDAHDLYTSLYQISQPVKLSDLYCFHYTASNEPFQFERQLGWNKFNLINEFRRQNVPNSKWCLTKLNYDYSLCDTYSKILFVPSSATDQILIASAKFRSKGRLPVLSYYYKKNSASICRCSQPLSGLKQRSVEDEQLLNCILQANEQNNTPKLLYVVDTRPMINAMANRAAGKGYENSNFYENIKFHFFGIENIHVMRGSLQKLIETCEIKVPLSNSFISGIANSGWLKHIKSVLETAFFVAKTVESGISVVVHCSDGWDRTAQTCSLAGLILDPYYRTLDGFQCLIEKEWLSFGHKFTDRCGHIQIGDSKEVAPVFTQFIDAVWQITQQFPNEFEFNENYLFAIHDHVYSCQYGTFIGNCEREREEFDVKNTTYSLWAKLDTEKEEYLNPLYNLSKEPKLSFLQVQLLPQLIRFWRSMYNRFDFGIHPRECLTDLLTVTYNHTKSLEGHINYLNDKIDQIQQLKNKQQKLNLIDTNLNDTKQSLLTKQNSLESQSIKSFDSINSSLKIVEECMQRLQMKHNNQLNEQVNESSTYLDNYGDKRDSINKVDLNLIELINSIQSVSLDWQNVRRTSNSNVRKCICGISFEQTNYRTTVNCWSCGMLYCCRCIEARVKLPGLLFKNDNNHENIKLNCDQQIESDDLMKLDHHYPRRQNEANTNELLTINKQTIDQQNNEKNKRLNNKYKVHPLEQLDQQIDQKLTKQLIEKEQQQIEQTKMMNSSRIHYLEQTTLDDEEKDEGFEPIELGIECDENTEHIISSTTTESTDLINGNRYTKSSLIYEYLPVCSACYRQIVKVN